MLVICTMCMFTVIRLKGAYCRASASFTYTHLFSYISEDHHGLYHCFLQICHPSWWGSLQRQTLTQTWKVKQLKFFKIFPKLLICLNIFQCLLFSCILLMSSTPLLSLVILLDRTQHPAVEMHTSLPSCGFTVGEFLFFTK